MFQLLTCAIGLVCGGFTLWSYRVWRDVFHPLVIIAPMLMFLYVYMPTRIVLEGLLFSYLTDEQAVFVQLVNLVGVSSLVLGVVVGQRLRRAAPRSRSPSQRRILVAAMVLGGVGIACYAYTIEQVGGLSAAYGEAYGGGTAELGYVRDGVLLTLPGVLILFYVWGDVWAKPAKIAVVAAFSAPLLVQGLLGARRGPTFMTVAGLVGGWYLARGRRPRAAVVAVGGAALGVLMLFIVSNRGNIHLGSEWDLSESPTAYLAASEGNEFLFGAGTIISTAHAGHTWGGRYIAVLFFRPIPRLLWPTKYEDASLWLGIPNMELTAGINPDAFQSTVGWVGAHGSAPGLVADMWADFGWASTLALFCVGWLLGRTWRKQRATGGVWAVMYGLAMALMVYLVMQTVEAMLFRMMEMGIPTWLAWRWASTVRRAPLPGSARQLATPAGKA